MEAPSPARTNLLTDGGARDVSFQLWLRVASCFIQELNHVVRKEMSDGI